MQRRKKTMTIIESTEYIEEMIIVEGERRSVETEIIERMGQDDNYTQGIRNGNHQERHRDSIISSRKLQQERGED
ncbi:hypothetical protein TIFTF001_025513 [Ficus carica]|uniref:Uncharacterized protein n=1 Tax=Ficus carica TaxID=3494 RepID=A0AA88AR63_FICCA|nr:hypothetical protein TIFTF001_025513 [Ficus carica]